MTSSMASSLQVESRALRPVAARLVSYGRSAKMAQQATLYVLRVARGGRQWYVARRFSEFRALHTTLKTLLATPHGHPSDTTPSRMCAQCRELGSALAAMAFPSRFAGFGTGKEKVESQRMQQLNAFVQVLLETTQGLLATQDDDDEYDDWLEDEEVEDRCDALRVVREFLLVHEHLHDDTAQKKVTLTQPSSSVASDRPRLASSLSIASSVSAATATTTFRVQDLDVMFRPTSPLSTWAAVEIEAVATKAVSSLELPPQQHADDELLFLADYASPATDAVIHRQLHAREEDVDTLARPTIEAMRRADSHRLSRRL